MYVFYIVRSWSINENLFAVLYIHSFMNISIHIYSYIAMHDIFSLNSFIYYSIASIYFYPFLTHSSLTTCIISISPKVLIKCICFTLQRIEQKKTIYITSCISALKMWFKDHMFVVGAVAVALAFPQFLGIILTHIFVGQIQEQIEECSKPPMYKYRPDRQPFIISS